MKLTRAAIFTSNLGGGAFPSIASALALGLRAHGVDKVFLVHLDGKLPSSIEIPDGLELVRLFPRRTISSPVALSRFLRGARPQVTISMPATSNIAAITGWLMSGRVGRLVVNDHAMMSHEAWVEHRGDPRVRSLPALARCVYPVASGVVAVNHQVLDDLVEKIGVRLDPRRTTVIPNPVNVEQIRRLAEASPPHPWVRDKTTPVGVAVGRLARQKNYPLLLEVMSRLSGESRIRLVVIGEGPERAALESQVERLGLRDRVDLHGSDANPYPTIAGADLLILPSEEEAFGLVVVEALACGVPVVATDCAGPKAILGQGGGVVVPRGDPDALASAIADVVQRGGERRTPASEWRELTARYAPDRIAGEWLEFIGGLPDRAERRTRSRAVVGAS